ncbi:MAG: nucleotidyl transferase AbiEii/AbiGii toxin family protein [Bacteroidia bacterium]
MLHRETVNSELFGLLIELFHDDYFNDYFLVGGTALALKYGHRVSVDIDLFTKSEINIEELLQRTHDFGEVDVTGSNKGGLNVLIDGIKVDFVRHDYPLIKPVEHHGEFKLLSNIDIAAMKIGAIISRRSKKDFIDFFRLSKDFSLKEMMKAYTDKYGHQLFTTAILKSLTDFGVADSELTPKLYLEEDWEGIKIKIREFVIDNSFNA